MYDEIVERNQNLSEFRPENQEKNTDNMSTQVPIGHADQGNVQTNQPEPIIVNPENPDGIGTVHSNADTNPVVRIPIVDYALNYRQNLIIFEPFESNRKL